jgi:hypothetical protein
MKPQPPHQRMGDEGSTMTRMLHRIASVSASAGGPRLGSYATLLGALGAAGALATCTETDAEYDCSDEGRTTLYEKRIKPLLEEDRPKSCNQCHLSGVDLSLFIRDDPCQTMACMVNQGIVDLGAPESSLLLSWIDRAAPESDGITDAVLAEERQGVLEWIEQSAQCGLCAEQAGACGGEEPGTMSDCEIHHDDPSTYSTEDPGDCSDKTLEVLFSSTFFPWRGRCFPCHFDGFEEEVPDAPKWIGVGACGAASLATMRRVIERGYVDVEDPTQSLYLLKPLEEELGGVEHGGGDKMHSTDEEGYQAMLYWATRYADCVKATP